MATLSSTVTAMVLLLAVLFHGTGSSQSSGGQSSRESLPPPSGNRDFVFGFWDEAAHANGTLPAPNNLALTSNLELIPANKPNHVYYLLNVSNIFFTASTGTGTGTVHLRRDYAAVWSALEPSARAAVNSSKLLGFFLGDELVGRGLSLASLETAAATVKASFPFAMRYMNEAGHVFLWKNYTGVPPSLSHISVDLYHFQPVVPGPNGSGWCTPTPSSAAWDKVIAPLATCVEQIQAFYRQLLYPKMQDDQLALVLPGAFASATNPHCDAACYDVMCAQDAYDFYDWVLGDWRLLGMFVYHWSYIATSRPVSVVLMHATRTAPS